MRTCLYLNARTDIEGIRQIFESMDVELISVDSFGLFERECKRGFADFGLLDNPYEGMSGLKIASFLYRKLNVPIQFVLLGFPKKSLRYDPELLKAAGIAANLESLPEEKQLRKLLHLPHLL